ncbi:ABC transporter ATP-binding protein [Acetobacter sp. UBA5411]|uniref:ABC transporter ATP-binding protein n=1 Tax=Acetobacter sp. UBA5411 TaxID=1945905 RepID=UPI0025C64E3F|nr:ABC transporter ATP-binding protein [Acetobacter sp. UBA5411]
MSTGPLLRLDSVNKVFPGGSVGLDSISLSIERGEFLSLLGSSGCGKTTTLRIIAGFEMPTSGRVFLDERDITPLRPFDRPVNTVFQDYALFPNMNVQENIAFGLTLRGISGRERLRKVKEALELVGLPDKAEARVGSLSGGQRQRVALARALVCEPQLLLLDEPLSALDASLREHMQNELKRLQKELGTTFVMVTHDQTEALSISDRIAVMNKGHIEQIADPATLYDRPASRFVAGFIGTTNLLSGVYLQRETSGIRFQLTGDWRPVVTASTELAAMPGTALTLAIRPEDIIRMKPGAPDSFSGTISSIAFHGHSLRLLVKLGNTDLWVDMPRDRADMDVREGAMIELGLRPGACCPLLAA